jgi:hypothetical protein
MKSIGKWILGAAVVAGGLGLGATTAQAAQFGVYVGTGRSYVPPSPGPGYVWAAGYESGGYWVPGRWNFAGARYGGGYYRGGEAYYQGQNRDWDRHRDWDRDRNWDRRGDGDRDHRWNHEREEHEHDRR